MTRSLLVVMLGGKPSALNGRRYLAGVAPDTDHAGSYGRPA
jgi:hypothetical protein